MTTIAPPADAFFEAIVCAAVARAKDELRAELRAADRPTTSPYLTVAEAADYLRCSKQRVYDLLSSRRLSKKKDGSRVLVERESIHAYLATS
jgi:excisionase family DNA binding protein